MMYRLKTRKVKAYQWLGKGVETPREFAERTGLPEFPFENDGVKKGLSLPTLTNEPNRIVSKGDWIIVDMGEYIVVDDASFPELYEPVENNEPDNMIYTKSGKPFKTLGSAKRKAEEVDGVVCDVEGGYAICTGTGPLMGD